MPKNKEGEVLSELQDVDVLKVSLVGHPANRQKFLVIKNEEGGSDMPKDKAILEQEAAEAAAQVEKALGEKLTSLLEGLSPADLKALMKLVADKLGIAEPEKAKKPEDKYGYPEPKDKTKKAVKPANPEDIVKKADLDPEVKAQIELLIKAKDESEVKIQKALADAAHERDLRLQREYLEKAQSFKGLPGKAEDLAAILKNLGEADPELYKKVEALLANTSMALEKSALMEEYGKRGGPEIAASATDEVMRLVNDLVSKGEGKLSFADALIQVEKLAPEKYLRYTQEVRSR